MKYFNRQRKDVSRSPPPIPHTTARSSVSAPAHPSPSHLAPEPATTASPSSKIMRSLSAKVGRTTPRPVPPSVKEPKLTVDMTVLKEVPPLASSTTNTNSLPRLSSPHVAGPLFRLAQLPATCSVSLHDLLKKSGRTVTLNKADAARAAMHTTLANARDLPLLTSVVTAYIPYALTIKDLSHALTAKGYPPSRTIVWRSGLAAPHLTTVPFTGGPSLDAVMTLTLAALNLLRPVLETPRKFGTQPDHILVAQIKELQAAAGILLHVRDVIAPPALAEFVGEPPAELTPQVAHMLHMLALTAAQALHVRRASTSAMSDATLAKLSVAARDHSLSLREALAACERASIALSPDFSAVSDELTHLVTGWAYLYAAPAFETAAPKIALRRGAIEELTTASNGHVVGEVAKGHLEPLHRKLDDAIGDNRVIHQEAVPELADVQLPPGRSLVSATSYEAPRIAKADTASSKQRQQQS